MDEGNTEQNKKEPKLNWKDFDKLTENQRAILQAHKNVQDRKRDKSD